VEFIIKVMTRHVHKYVRGLFEKDKITFLLKILITAKKLTGADVGVFLKAGAGEDIKAARPKLQGNQFNFIDEKAWLNIIAFSKHTFGSPPFPTSKNSPISYRRTRLGGQPSNGVVKPKSKW
jgi:dynein heavy chain, axonemal